MTTQNLQPRVESTVGILTYDYSHLKTEQVVHKLLDGGFRKIKVFALPYTPRPGRAVVMPHRPNQAEAITTRELARANGLGFVEYDGQSELEHCDFYLVTGAGILPPNVVRGKKILNAHPGIIPSARGLDAFKWSIYDGVELGVTLHYIDEDVDSGEVITIVKTPVYQGDTLHTLARRHYEREIDVLAGFVYHMEHRNVEGFPVGEAHKRMPSGTEAEMVRRFDAYRRKFAR